MRPSARRGTLAVLLACAALAQQPQNPSPMVEHTRSHPRLAKRHPAGRREKLELGTLYLPPRARPVLLFFFHGGGWLPEVAAAQRRLAVVTVQAGAGSAGYGRLFEDPGRFLRLVSEAEAKSGIRFARLMLGGWSAGCGAIRQILRSPASYARVDAVLAIDGIHTDYVDGKPGPLESKIGAENLQVWLHLARDAVAGRKRMIVTHSEIFPGTYASTTETADYLLRELGLRRHTVLKWGPMGLQQLSEAKAAGFLLMGFAGNSAPDHVDQLQALPEWLRRL
jgi:hypothetical protein